MSTILIGRNGTNPTVLALGAIADAGRACLHCDADYSLAHDPDAPAVTRLRIAHDAGCPVLRELIARTGNRAQRRAARLGRR